MIDMNERELAAVRAAIAERDAMESKAQQIRRAAVRAGLMGMNGTSVAMHKLEAFASILLDEENEACAEVCSGVGKVRIEGETLAKAIRERRKA